MIINNLSRIRRTPTHLQKPSRSRSPSPSLSLARSPPSPAIVRVRLSASGLCRSRPRAQLHGEPRRARIGPGTRPQSGVVRGSRNVCSCRGRGSFGVAAGQNARFFLEDQT